MRLPQERPALAIFDWDDTLVDNYAAIHAAINAARAAFNLPVWNLQETRENCRRALTEIFPVWFGGEWEKARVIFYDTFAARHLEFLTVKAGAADVLDFFSAHKIPIAINSNKKSDYLHKEIDYLQWSSYFGVIVGAGDVARGKPAPDGILSIRKKFGTSGKSWFIGDNILDAETARAGDCLPVIINHETNMPDDIVHFADMQSLLEVLPQCVVRET